MKTLAEIDKNYKEKSKKFTDEQKIEYCTDLIDRFQSIIEKNRVYLSDRVKKEFADLIEAAQREMKKVNGKG